MDTFNEWKNLKETVRPDAGFRERTRTSLIRAARALGTEGTRHSRMTAGFILGAVLTLAGLAAIAVAGGGISRGGVQARAPLFEI